jgi:bifunctional DNA-binding transcriptional regulator/antitoxin component of YhaV-PrlF toxin-antitoxin module
MGIGQQSGEIVGQLEIAARGRITVLKMIREQFALSEGDKIEFEPQGDGSCVARLVR